MISAYRDGMFVQIDRAAGLGEVTMRLTLAEAAKLLSDLRQVFTDRPIYPEEQDE